MHPGSLVPRPLAQLRRPAPAPFLRLAEVVLSYDLEKRGSIVKFRILIIYEVELIAGRTYNDLGQYPIFPWVLKDYRSETLDLSDPRVYRDLRYPVGAQNPKRREEQQQRYADLEDNYHTAMQTMLEENGEEGDDVPVGVMPPFHWGSHYSVAGFVIWYLMRLEPFTSLHVQLQDGKFDKPDRLFRSIGETGKLYNQP